MTEGGRCCVPQVPIGPPFQKLGTRIEGERRCFLDVALRHCGFVYFLAPLRLPGAPPPPRSDPLAELEQPAELAEQRAEPLRHRPSCNPHLRLPALHPAPLRAKACRPVYQGNEMYKLMLDPTTMAYTCGLWRDPAHRGFVQFPDDAYKS